MKTFHSLALPLCAVFLGVATAVSAQTPIPRFQTDVSVTADAPPITLGGSEYNLAFTAPIQVPGASLAPGEYVFRVNVEDVPHVIQVLSFDRRQAYAMFHSARAERLIARDDHQFRFEVLGDGAPKRLKTWFLPGMRTGHVLLYPKAQVGTDRLATAR